MKRFFLPLALVLMIVLGATALYRYLNAEEPPLFNGTILAEPEPAPSFMLNDAAGNPVSLSDFEGEIVILYFGYTYCPDICPTTMSDLAQVQREVDDDGDEVQVILITVDPERDSPEAVQDYAESFHPDFIGLAGTEATTAAVAEKWGVFYQKQEGTEASGYLVDHTARIFLIDQEGRYRLTYAFGTSPAAIIDDVKILLQEDGQGG